VLYNQEQWFDRTHNVVFDWLIAGGFVGFIAYFLIFVFLIRMLVKSDQLSKREKAVFVGMLGAYVFQNLFVFDQIGSYMLFFAFIAYMHSLESEGHLFPKLFNVQEGTRDRLIVPGLIALLFVVPYMVNASGYFQSRTAIRALNVKQASTVEQLQDSITQSRDNFKKALAYDSFGTAEIRERLPEMTIAVLQSAQIADSLKGDFVALAREQMTQQLSETPFDARYYIIYGGFLAQTGAMEEAVQYLEKAIELSPDKQIIYTQTAQVYGALGNNDRMIELTKESYEIYQENDSAWSAYVLALGAVGELELYQSLVQEAFEEERYSALEGVLRLQLQNNPEAQEIKDALAEVYRLSDQVEKLELLLES